ncbi:MAG TPA: HAD hydrolase family protein [Burkholderiales bacterium]|nr:HAD hydrolase family protein [Burkholderiales bacterium]
MAQVSADALQRARRLRLMVFDVDGVLTDGRLWFGPDGETLKVFHVRDGHGLRMLAEHGIATALLTGRRSAAVAARAAELGLAHVLQGVQDKGPAYDELLSRLGVDAAAAGYMGDDLPDLPVLSRCGFAIAPRDAHAAALRVAHYVAEAPAGAGAVREVCEFVLRAQGQLGADTEAA